MRRLLALVTCVALAAAGCAQDETESTVLSEAVTAPASAESLLEAPDEFEEVEPIVPETTKPLDESSESALTNYGDDGTLTFSEETGQVAELSAGDVVASGVSDATPTGLLRTVTSVHTENGRTIVETSPAALTDAVEQGSGSITTELLATDVIMTRILQDGVNFVGAAAASPYAAPLPQAAAMAGDLLIYEIDETFGTKNVGVQVKGKVALDPILIFKIGIKNWKLNFKTLVGFEQTGDLTVIGNAEYKFDTEVPLAEHAFGPYEFMLGPIPVVIVPVMTVYLTAEGKLVARVTYEVHQVYHLAGGFKYRDGEGFEGLSEQWFEFDETLSYEGHVNLFAGVGAGIDILLYNAVGPTVRVEGGPRLRADIQGIPPAGDLWAFEGCTLLKAGMAVNDAFGIERWDATLYEACDIWKNQENTQPTLDTSYYAKPPATEIESPEVGVTEIQATGEQFEQPQATLVVENMVTDTFGQYVNCAWSSNDPDDIVPEPQTVQVQSIEEWQVPIPTASTDCGSGEITLVGPGERTVTLFVSDGVGADGTDEPWSGASATYEFLIKDEFSGQASITVPEPGAILQHSMPNELTGSATGQGKPFGPYNWFLLYPTDEDGNPTGDTLLERSFRKIGEGATLQWTPSETDLLFPGDAPDVGPCAPVDSYGVLQLKVGSSLDTAAGEIRPASTVVGFANPFYVPGPACEGIGTLVPTTPTVTLTVPTPSTIARPPPPPTTTVTTSTLPSPTITFPSPPTTEP